MTTMKISINQITDITDFIQQVSKSKYKIIAKSGRYVVNAKSIMGLFSLNLSVPITIECEHEIESNVIESLKKFEVE